MLYLIKILPLHSLKVNFIIEATLYNLKIIFSQEFPMNQKRELILNLNLYLKNKFLF